MSKQKPARTPRRTPRRTPARTPAVKRKATRRKAKPRPDVTAASAPAGHLLLEWAKRLDPTGKSRKIVELLSSQPLEAWSEVDKGPSLASVERVIGEQTQLGALGLVEVTLTDEEEAVLSEPVPIDRVRVRPDGAVYLPHQDYTRWFCRAFGRLGWSIVPSSKPFRAERRVCCHYLLYIHGQPAAMALGEQPRHDDLTFGDAAEGTVASALRRCAKRLGVGLELWDRPWTEAFLRDHAVRVTVEDPTGETSLQWRLVTSPPLPGEHVAVDIQAANGAPDRKTLITPLQVERLERLIVNAGRDRAAVIEWLRLCYEAPGLADIALADYEDVCVRVEGPGDLMRVL